MARSQSELKTWLEVFTDADHVYIQPPSTLQYPCIMIENDKASNVKHADDVKYLLKKGYTITLMDREPDSPIRDQIEALPHCTFDRRFKSDGVYHNVFQLFF